MRSRPQEQPDPRLLIVIVTEADVRSQPSQERGGASLSDRALEQLITQLEQFKPRVISGFINCGGLGSSSSVRFGFGGDKWLFAGLQASFSKFLDNFWLNCITQPEPYPLIDRRERS
ncbi:hypothetical protein PL11201_530197 [Planktothrix sp. PCC 11201]|nr:hypothetical protein PL11201_530197 [Planktothrix sp. PCC 11201]